MIGDNCAYERTISASNRLSIWILGVAISKELLFFGSTQNKVKRRYLYRKIGIVLPMLLRALLCFQLLIRPVHQRLREEAIFEPSGGHFALVLEYMRYQGMYGARATKVLHIG